jgi:hypothetical protein
MGRQLEKNTKSKVRLNIGRLLTFRSVVPLKPRKSVEEMTWADITVSTLCPTQAELEDAKRRHPERYGSD